MDTIEIKISRIKLAFIIAVVADMLEFPITWLGHFGWEWVRLLAKFMGVLLDCGVMWAMTRLLGYHWVFWPSFFVECIPDYDMFPSWVACVAYVVWERKKAQETEPQSPQPRPLIDVQRLKAVGASLAERLTLRSPEPPDTRREITVETCPSTEAASEERLKRLNDLRDKNLISQTEFDAKREQILADI